MSDAGQPQIRATERFAALADHLSDGVVVMGAGFEVVWASPSQERLLGWTAEERRGRAAMEVAHPDDAAAARELLRELVERGPGGRVTAVLRMRHRDGSTRHIEATATNLLADPTVEGIVVITRDITDRVEAEAQRDRLAALHAAIVTNMGEAVSIVDRSHRVTYSAPSILLRRAGFTPEERIGRDIFELVHPDDLDTAHALMDAALAEPGVTKTATFRVRRANDVNAWTEVSATNLLDDEHVEGIVVVSRDATERFEAAREREIEAARFSALMQNLNEVIVVLDREFRNTYTAPTNVGGAWTPADRAGRSALDVIHPDDRPRAIEQLRRLRDAGAGGTVQTELRVRVPEGHYVFVEVVGVNALDDPAVDGLVITMRDVSERTKALERERRQAERFESLIRNMSDAVLVVDQHAQVTYASPALTTILGHPADQVTGRHIREVLDQGATGLGSRVVESLVLAASDEGTETELRTRHANGTPRWLLITANRLDGSDPAESVVLTVRDVTERRRADDLVRFQALHDELTGLPNRALLHDRIELAVRRSRATGRHVGLVFCDLDRFKLVNDTKGHSVGDRLLVEAAGRLMAALAESDTVARFGDDEFVVLVEGADATVAEDAAERTHQVFAAPFDLAGEQVYVTVSIGIALAGPLTTAESLLREADTAMHHAKDQGRGRSVRFRSEHHERAGVRFTLESELRQALDRDELVVHYQPVVSLPGRRVIGAEALVRWDHPERGLVPPIDFLGVAEETGLIVPIGATVLERACAAAAADPHLGSVAVNLSPRQFLDGDLPAVVAASLARVGLEPDRLVLEITESSLLAATGAVRGVLASLKSLGVRIALDDFGTGYSSLAYLRAYPVDIVKIDRSFVEGVATDPTDRALVSSVVGLAKALRLDVVAEGIETEAQSRAIEALGCAAGQGWLFGKPAPDFPSDG